MLQPSDHNLDMGWLPHTGAPGEHQPMGEHCKPSSASVLVHGVNLGPKATVLCPN